MHRALPEREHAPDDQKRLRFGRGRQFDKVSGLRERDAVLIQETLAGSSGNASLAWSVSVILMVTVMLTPLCGGRRNRSD